MNFTGIYNSSLRLRGFTIFLFLALTSRGELVVPLVIRSNENLPTHTHTCTWTLDHITILPTYKLFIEPWCAGPGLCMTRKVSIMSCISTRPHFKENNYSIKQTRRFLNSVVRSPSRETSPLLSLFFHMSTQLTAGSAECWPNTSKVLVWSVERSQASFVQWRTKWDWGLRGYTEYPVNVAKCTLDRLVDQWSPKWRSITDTHGLDIQTNRLWRNAVSNIIS